MEKCLQCSKELKHVPGRKQKSFCNVNCRNKYFYAKRKKDIELVKTAIASLPGNTEVLTEDAGIKPISLKPRKKPNGGFIEGAGPTINLPVNGKIKAYYAPPLPKNTIDELRPDNLAIQLQIDAIKKEVCPKERDTPMGRKSWQMDQVKRIQELQAKLK